MGLCQQLVRFTVARKKLLFSAAVVYVIGLYVAYGVYSGSSRVNTKHDASWFGGQWIARWVPSWPLKVQMIAGSSLLSPIAASPDANFVRQIEDIIVVAIGGGITSKGSSLRLKIGNVTGSDLLDLEFFKTLLTSFCHTAGSETNRYHYRFYLGHDRDDPFFSDPSSTDSFRRTFDAETARQCRPRSVDTSLKLIACRHSGHPAWAQNDAMLDAYLDGVDYFYRVNDDTKMLTGGWTDIFIHALNSYEPPLVGVVGPKHVGGNTAILTYDFVHRTHVDIFGFYYPRVFSDWYGDGWITRVYQPGRSTKVEQVRLEHTMKLGQRYHLVKGVSEHVGPRLAHDKKLLNRYVVAVFANHVQLNLTSSTDVSSGRRIFAVLLNSSEPRMIWGAIRNAQLIRVYMPEWKLRIFISSENTISQDSTLRALPTFGSSRFEPPETVQSRVVDTLRVLGVEVIKLNSTSSVRRTPLQYLLTDPNIDYILMRRADWRLSDKEAAAINDWVRAAELGGPDAAVVHCIHDDVVHARSALVNDLWGFRPAAFRRRLIANGTRETVFRLGNDFDDDADSFLSRNVWPLVADVAYCHDGVETCHGGPPAGDSLPFPTDVNHDEGFVGQSYDENHEKISNETIRQRLVPCARRSGRR